MFLYLVGIVLNPILRLHFHRIVFIPMDILRIDLGIHDYHDFDFEKGFTTTVLGGSNRFTLYVRGTFPDVIEYV